MATTTRFVAESEQTRSLISMADKLVNTVVWMRNLPEAGRQIREAVEAVGSTIERIREAAKYLEKVELDAQKIAFAHWTEDEWKAAKEK